MRKNLLGSFVLLGFIALAAMYAFAGKYEAKIRVCRVRNQVLVFLPRAVAAHLNRSPRLAWVPPGEWGFSGGGTDAPCAALFPSVLLSGFWLSAPGTVTLRGIQRVFRYWLGKESFAFVTFPWDSGMQISVGNLLSVLEETGSPLPPSWNFPARALLDGWAPVELVVRRNFAQGLSAAPLLKNRTMTLGAARKRGDELDVLWLDVNGFPQFVSCSVEAGDVLHCGQAPFPPQPLPTFLGRAFAETQQYCEARWKLDKWSKADTTEGTLSCRRAELERRLLACAPGAMDANEKFATAARETPFIWWLPEERVRLQACPSLLTSPSLKRLAEVLRADPSS